MSDTGDETEKMETGSSSSATQGSDSRSDVEEGIARRNYRASSGGIPDETAAAKLSNGGTQATPGGHSDSENSAEFWVPPTKTTPSAKDDTSRIIEFKEKEKATFRSYFPSRREIGRGWFSALLVLLVGLWLILSSNQEAIEEEIKNCLLLDVSEKKDSHAARKSFFQLLFGEIFFNAAVVASYEIVYRLLLFVCRLSKAGFGILWKRVANTSIEAQDAHHNLNLKEVGQYLADSFHWKVLREFMAYHIRDLLRIVPVAIFFIIGIPLLTPAEAKTQLNWGKVLFETGLIYWAMRAMFFVPQPDDEIRKLENKVSELETSVAIGLADGHYKNFLKIVLKDIQGEHKKKNDSTVSITYEDKTETVVNVPEFAVAVPRNIDWAKETPINSTIEEHKDRDIFACHVTKISEVRPKTVYISHNHTTEAPSMSILLDVPTTLEVVIDNIKENRKLNTKEEKDAQYWLEINRFTYRLAWRAYKDGMQDYVKILEVDNSLQSRFLAQWVSSGQIAIKESKTKKREV